MSLDNRNQILAMVKTAVDGGCNQHKACDVVAITPRTYQRWILAPEAGDGRCGALKEPGNKLTEFERAKVISIASRKSFVIKAHIRLYQPLQTVVNMSLPSPRFIVC